MGASLQVVEPTPQGLKLVVLVPFITVELNLMPPKTSGDGHFEPAVTGMLE